MPKRCADIQPETLDFEIFPPVKLSGFQEYGARWRINGMGHETAPKLSLKDIKALAGGGILWRKVVDVNPISGARVTPDDSSRVLVRASSSKPELVIILENMQSDDDMRDLFHKEMKPRQIYGNCKIQSGNLTATCSQAT